MSRYRTSPLLPIIGMLIGAVFMLLLFSGCTTTQQSNQKSLADLRDTACPLTQAVILGYNLIRPLTLKSRNNLSLLSLLLLLLVRLIALSRRCTRCLTRRFP